MPKPKVLEEGAQRDRESVALWMFNDDYHESQLLLRPIIQQAKEELMKRKPWMRKYFETR